MRALDTHALGGGGGGTVSDQGGPKFNIAGTNGPGGPLIAGDHKFRDIPIVAISDLKGPSANQEYLRSG